MNENEYGFAFASQPGRRMPVLWRGLCLAAIWSISAAVFFRASILSNFERIAGNAVDTRFDIMVRENFYRFLRGAAEFASPPMFFPTRNTLGYSDAYLLDAVVYVPLRWLGADPFLSFELLCVALSLLGFASFYFLLVRYARVRFEVAALSASLFSFSNALYIKIGHPQMLEICWTPLIAILLLEAGCGLGRSTRRWDSACAFSGGVLLGLLFATGFYVAWFFSILLVLTLAIGVFFCRCPSAHDRWEVLRLLSRSALFFAAGLAIGLVPFFRVYLPTLAEHAGRGFDEYLTYAPEIVDVVNVSSNNLFWGGLLNGVISADRLSNGEIDLATTPLVTFAYICCVVAIWRRWLLARDDDRIVRLVVLSSSAAILLMWLCIVKIGATSAFLLFWRVVPGAGAIRSAGRAMIVFNGVIVAVVAVAISRVRDERPSIGPGIAVFVLMVFAAEQINTTTNHELSRGEQLAFLESTTAPPSRCSSFFIASDPSRGDLEQQVDATLIAQRTGLPTVNGYSGWAPMGWALEHVHRPSYGPRVWDWVTDHVVAVGLCAYSPVSRSWTSIFADSPAVRDEIDQADQKAYPTLPAGAVLDFRMGGNSSPYLTGSWSDPEAPGTWTDGRHAGIAASILGWDGDMVVEVTAHPFLAAIRHPALTVEVVANGSQVSTWSYDVDHDDTAVTRLARIPAALLAKSTHLRLVFRIGSPKSPLETGVSGDGRKLGLFVSQVRFRAAD